MRTGAKPVGKLGLRRWINPIFNATVAQLAERPPCKRGVDSVRVRPVAFYSVGAAGSASRLHREGYWFKSDTE